VTAYCEVLVRAPRLREQSGDKALRAVGWPGVAERELLQDDRSLRRLGGRVGWSGSGVVCGRSLIVAGWPGDWLAREWFCLPGARRIDLFGLEHRA